MKYEVSWLWVMHQEGVPEQIGRPARTGSTTVIDTTLAAQQTNRTICCLPPFRGPGNGIRLFQLFGMPLIGETPTYPVVSRHAEMGGRNTVRPSCG